MPPIKVDNIRVDENVKNILQIELQETYLADMFLPTVKVRNDSGIVKTWGNEHMRSYDLKRSVHDMSLHYVESEMGADGSYKINYYDIASQVSVQLVDQEVAPIDLFTIEAVALTESIKLNRDIALAAQLSSTAVLTSNETLSGTSQWSDYTNSKPKTQIDTSINTVLLNISKKANSIFMSEQVATTLRNHPDYINLYGGARGTVPGGVPSTAFAQLLKDVHGFKNVYIGSTVQITSKKGQAETRGFVFGKDCVVFYRTDSPSTNSKSFGYSFVKDGSEVKRKHGSTKALKNSTT